MVFDLTQRKIDTDRQLSPARHNQSYPVLKNMRYLNTYNIGLSPGISIYRNFGSFFITPTLFIGSGGQFRNTNVNQIAVLQAFIKVNIKLSLGYWGEHFNIGMTAMNNSDTFNEKKESIQFHTVWVSLHIGYEI